MNMKLRQNCTFLKMYTNNVINVFEKPLFDSSFSYF
jgi:hypothetical protein